jgi:hypothetical protein
MDIARSRTRHCSGDKRPWWVGPTPVPAGRAGRAHGLCAGGPHHVDAKICPVAHVAGKKEQIIGCLMSTRHVQLPRSPTVATDADDVIIGRRRSRCDRIGAAAEQFRPTDSRPAEEVPGTSRAARYSVRPQGHINSSSSLPNHRGRRGTASPGRWIYLRLLFKAAAPPQGIVPRKLKAVGAFV